MANSRAIKIVHVWWRAGQVQPACGQLVPPCDFPPCPESLTELAFFPCLSVPLFIRLNQQSSPGVENLWGLHDVSRALWHLWVQDSIINSQYYYIEWSCNWGCFAKLCALYADQEEVDMEQQTGCKEEKEYIKAVCCHCAYLTYMQSTSWETLGWKKHKLESRFLGEILITSDMQMTLLLWQKVKMI